MNIVYIVSRYPALSETFIAREIAELTHHGWNPIICQLKWNFRPNRKVALRVQNAKLLSVQFNIAQWKLGWLWAWKHKREKLSNILKNLKDTEGNLFTRLKLLVILSTTLAIARKLDSINISHIRAHFLHSEAISASWLAMLINTNYSITGHTTQVHFPRSLILRVVRDAEFCVGISDEVVAFLANLQGSSNRVYLIRNGVYLDEFLPKVSHNGTTPYIILAVGRLIPKKGFDDLIQACALLKQSNDNWICNIIGEGSEYKRLSKLIHSYDLQKQVILLGLLEFGQVNKSYSQADLLVMPSIVKPDDVDGLPTVIIEALAAGLPVIATQVAAIPELILHNKTGLLTPPNNPVLLYSAIQQLLSDNELGMRLGNAGRGKVQREYDIKKSVGQLNDLIRDGIAS